MKTILVVGGGAAGATAASRAKRMCPSCRVVLVEAGGYITHAPCAIPYAIAGLSQEALWLYQEESFELERGVEVYTKTKVVDIAGGKAKLEGRLAGALDFDAVIIATGARPWVPQVEGLDKSGVVVLRGVDSVEEARSVLRGAASVVVVGAGYIGVEMADVLNSMGKKVVLIDAGPFPMSKVLDSDIGRLVASYMESRGVELRMGERIEKIAGGSKVEYVVTDKGRYPADAVVMATGVRPNVELAVKAGAKLGPTGAVSVNKYMEAGPPGVYVAGDIAESIHKVTGEPVWIPLATYANKMGYVAGTNAALGARAAEFPPVAGASVTKFDEMYVGTVGFTEAEARRKGMPVESYVVKTHDKARYMRELRDVTLKAVISRGRLIGVQAVGLTQSISGYIDLASQFIGRLVEDLFYAEYTYMPFTAPVWHPLAVVGRLWLRHHYRSNGPPAP
ncbi:FAD-dependent oxidoreductase [Pyrobaculum sp. 3827-6]|uniref:FAD-dependent oxidoreductase n=1 Tax=Pyrobaculum sp. 3827-6 TaxID=2983604 RepID=UPI0021D9F08B|nr:FAD-dependent oxidoreductase [Pyrobaculum sp. 3827-6]MCU7786743.1 FAD-dependent oxidoreductase [Pyrobaculum sp. 3827-6]